MSHKHDCCDTIHGLKIESITLDDGRKAERHTSINEEGDQIVEIFAEDKRPMKLEKRIVREHKRIVAKETHEVVRDGEVIAQEVHSLEPEAPLQIMSRIAVADHAKVVDGDYVKKADLVDGIVAAVKAVQEKAEVKEAAPAFFKAQSVVEQNVAEKATKATWQTISLIVVTAVQVFSLGYYMFFMR